FQGGRLVAKGARSLSFADPGEPTSPRGAQYIAALRGVKAVDATRTAQLENQPFARKVTRAKPRFPTCSRCGPPGLTTRSRSATRSPSSRTALCSISRYPADVL